VITIPDYRLRTRGKTVITFEERAADSPEAIKAWFFPGDNYGQEFVYPAPRAMQLAAANQQSVPSMPAEMAANTTAPATTGQEPSVAAMKQAPITRVSPSGEHTQMAQAMPPQPPAETAPAKELPRTGSELPLIALIGLLSLAGALGLRLLSRRLA
jgi:LPXTG-motif cell wall-anchored protein